MGPGFESQRDHSYKSSFNCLKELFLFVSVPVLKRKTYLSTMRESTAFEGRALLLESKNSAGEMAHRIAKHVYTSNDVWEKSQPRLMKTTSRRTRAVAWRYLVYLRVCQRRCESHSYLCTNRKTHLRQLALRCKCRSSSVVRFPKCYILHEVGAA